MKSLTFTIKCRKLRRIHHSTNIRILLDIVASSDAGHLTTGISWEQFMPCTVSYSSLNLTFWCRFAWLVIHTLRHFHGFVAFMKSEKALWHFVIINFHQNRSFFVFKKSLKIEFILHFLAKSIIRIDLNCGRFEYQFPLWNCGCHGLCLWSN